MHLNNRVSLIGKRFFCSAAPTFNGCRVRCNSERVFIEKANEHLASGDVAQCCEKLFGVVKFALRSYVDDLSKVNNIEPIDPGKWSYAKYRKLCFLLSKGMENQEAMIFQAGWAKAEQLHIIGWNQDQIEYEDAKFSIPLIQNYLKLIANLAKTRELAEKIHTGLFGFDPDSVALVIHEDIAKNNREQAFRVTLGYTKQQRNELVNRYKAKYQTDLQTELQIPNYILN